MTRATGIRRDEVKADNARRKELERKQGEKIRRKKTKT